MGNPPQDYHICPSCGTEFGYDDSGGTYEELRQEWLNSGAEWWSPVDKKPPGWNPYVQLFKAGLGFQPTATTSTTSEVQTETVIYVPRGIFELGERPSWPLDKVQITTAADT